MTQPIVPRALAALILRGPSFHDPFHELSGTGAHYRSRAGARSAPARLFGLTDLGLGLNRRHNPFLHRRSPRGRCGPMSL